MGESDDQLVSIGSQLAQLLYERGLHRESGRLLDVGCGYGRLAIGLKSTGFKGSYVGFDILKRHIAWCDAELQTSRYAFRHVDVRNGRYNPGGTTSATDMSFPVKTAARDVCALFSVFTHMYEADVRRYLSEVCRVLAPGGIAVTTWFLFDEDRLAAVTSPSAAHPLTHQISSTTRFESQEDPLKAIGYHERVVRAMAKEAGLMVSSIEHGTWAGNHAQGREFQDVVILRRPVTLRNRVGRALRTLNLR